jgi:murein DD-endopeptidase MepM/ murein hydrolase activator NlpD/beta-lactamase regulating signal transducer with metallopeptidase domain
MMAVSDLKSSWEALSPPALAWLLTFAIHSTLLLGLVWLITRYARSHRLRDLLWKTALVGGIFTATLQVFWSARPLSGRFDLSRSAPVHTQEVQAIPATYHLGDAGPETRASAMPAPVTYDWGQSSATATPWQERLASTLRGGAAWWLGLWLAGAVVAGLRFAVATRRLYTSLGHHRAVLDGPLADTLAQLCHVAGVRRRVRLTCSPRISSPLALGAREICLPQQALTRLDAAQQKSMLAHELAHVARCDPLWLVVSGALECLFFFQPLIRLARRHMQECAEYLCDDQAARYSGDGLALARCLVEVARWPRRARPVPVAAMAGSASALERRVRRLLDGSAARVESPRWWWVCLVVGVLVSVGCAGPGVSAQANITNTQMRAVKEEVAQADTTPAAHAEPGSLVWPVQGHITQGYREHPPQHLALDIAAEQGTPVVAAADGVVSSARWDDDYGNMVVVDHDGGLSTLYSKLLDYQVEAGDAVVQGQLIGRVGSTGKSTGPHLHFEVRQNGEGVNPLALLPDDLILENVSELTWPQQGALDALAWPVVGGRVTQSYSDKHPALDIAAAEGTPVLAAAAGVVTATRWDDDYGNVVILDHGEGLSTFYSKLSSYQVEVGDEVDVGQPIGQVGQTGRATGPHLHFELRQDGTRINPLPLLQD